MTSVRGEVDSSDYKSGRGRNVSEGRCKERGRVRARMYRGLGLRGKWWVYEVLGAADGSPGYSRSSTHHCLTLLLLSEHQVVVLLKLFLLSERRADTSSTAWCCTAPARLESGSGERCVCGRDGPLEFAAVTDEL